MDKYKHLLSCFKRIWSFKNDEHRDKLLEMILRKAMKTEDKVLDYLNETGYTDVANVFLIVPKKENVKVMLNSIFDNTDYKKEEIPLTKFASYDETISGKREFNMSDYSSKSILPLLKGYLNIKFRIKDMNYPMWIETEDFVIIVAPRIPNEN